MRIIKLIAHDRPVHCELDRETRILSASDGARYPLGNKEFTVLCRLAQTPGKPVKTLDLFDEAWKHSDGNLESVSKTVSDLRKKLRDTEPVKRFIETIPTVGYMLIAECEFRELPPPPPPLIQVAHREDSRYETSADSDRYADVAANADLGEPAGNENVMSALRTWKRRPGSCAGQEIVGCFEVDGCSSVETTCARVLGTPAGDLVEVTLDTPKGLHSKGEREWIKVSAMGSQAQLLEELADKKDRSTVVLRLRGHGAYICKRDFPDLDTGKMQHYRDPKPAILVLSAKLFQNDHDKVSVDDHSFGESASQAGGSRLSEEDAIAESDPGDIRFTEYEIRLSNTWSQFMEWLRGKTAPLEIVSIQADKNRESTFHCSGKPGHINYPIEVSCRKSGVPVTLRFDLVSEWLHPQILDLCTPDVGVAWDTSLFPVSTEQDKEVHINDPQATLRDAEYWVMFARRR